MSESTSPVIDPRHFRTVMGKFATGITVVIAEVDGQVHGMTANAFVSVSLNPPLVLVSVDNRAHMKAAIDQSGRFAISVLRAEMEYISTHFAGRHQEGYEPVFERRADHPVLVDAIAHIVTKLWAAYPGGDHTLFVGEVVHLESNDEEPVLYYAGKYRQLQPMGS